MSNFGKWAPGERDRAMRDALVFLKDSGAMDARYEPLYLFALCMTNLTASEAQGIAASLGRMGILSGGRLVRRPTDAEIKKYDPKESSS